MFVYVINFFLFQKEKSYKKEVGEPSLDRLSRLFAFSGDEFDLLFCVNGLAPYSADGTA